MDEVLKINTSDQLITRATHFFWFGIIIYNVGLAFPGELLLNVKTTQLVQLMGIMLFLPSAVLLVNLKDINNFLTITLFLFLCWSVLIILRGFIVDIEFFKRLLFIAPFSAFGFLVPFAFFFPNKLMQIRKVFFTTMILGVFFLIYGVIFNRLILEGAAQHRLPIELVGRFLTFLAIPSGFILLNHKYNPRVSLFAFSIIALAFFVALIRARRGLLLLTTLILFSSYLSFIFYGRGKLLKLFLSFIMLFFLIILGRELFLQNPGNIFGLIIERAGQDTRGWVEDSFYQDMGLIDWIIGRGINGQYYCPGLDEVEGTLTIYRLAIEKGYLQIVLRGGLISLFFIIIIAIPAIYKGFFKSRNLLSKTAAIWIIFFFINLYTTDATLFSLNYLIVWLSIAICHDRDLRSKTDEEIKNALF